MPKHAAVAVLPRGATVRKSDDAVFCNLLASAWKII